MKKTFFTFVLGALALVSSASAADYVFFSPEMTASHLKEYTPEERQAIEKDLRVVRSVCFSAVGEKSSNPKPLYIATAGGPGARKTTILERFIRKQPNSSQIVYVDPDHRALKFMAHTYYSQSLCAAAVAQQENYGLAVKSAYQKWRGASNYIALTLLEEAFAKRVDIAHGTTSTGGHIANFLLKVKEAGYEIVLLLCSAEDNFKQQAVKYRNEEQKFYQSEPEEVVSKGKAFPERMKVYFTHADTLYLFWNDDLFNGERLAAVLKAGNVQVQDPEALNRFIDKFERDRTILIQEGSQIPSWTELLDLYRKRF